MCVGCRSRSAKADLVRVVRMPGGKVQVDASGRHAGRGAYVHRSPDCLARAARAGALARGLKARLAVPEAASLMQELREALGVTS